MLLPLITDSDQISFELLDLILSNIVEPNKSTKIEAYKLSKELITKTKDTLEPYIKNFLNHILLEEMEEDSYLTAPKVFELLQELHSIIPSVLVDVMPNLECKLKSNNEVDRIREFQHQFLYYIILVTLINFQKLFNYLENYFRKKILL